MNDVDTLGAAQKLLKMLGQAAPEFAARRADEAIAQGDPEGKDIWKQIMRYSEELQRAGRDYAQEVAKRSHIP